MPRLTFVSSDSVAVEAAAAFAKQERRIRERLPEVEIRHRGGTSVPGVLTTGDVDLHVRTDKTLFAEAREALGELYIPMHTEVWHDEGAFFADPASRPQVEVALTAIGGLDDLHHGEAWDRIASDPVLTERYNALKRSHEGGSEDEYLAAKREFFYGKFQLRPAS